MVPKGHVDWELSRPMRLILFALILLATKTSMASALTMECSVFDGEGRELPLRHSFTAQGDRIVQKKDFRWLRIQTTIWNQSQIKVRFINKSKKELFGVAKGQLEGATKLSIRFKEKKFNALNYEYRCNEALIAPGNLASTR